MSMSKSILCAVDISQPDRDEKVVQIAAKLAKLDGARLDVITVVPNFGMSLVGTYFDENFQKQAVKEAKERLQSVVSDVVGSDMDDEVRHIVAAGSIYEEIIELASQTKSDLIVIGAHKPELKDYLLGPNAARVVRHSKCSVYVVRDM
ncbi:MAG: universal stress protein [Cohaesibacter sp.]|nr:universal stress protein [Cohaesibacter sp.]